MAHVHEIERVCEQPGCMENPKARSLRRVLKAATWWNGIMGITLTAIGAKIDSPAAIADGVHSATDVLPHGGHVITHQKEERHAEGADPRAASSVRRVRVATASLIAAGAVYSGYHTIEAIQNPEELSFNWLALSVEATSATVSASLFAATRKYNDGSLAAKDTEQHLGTDSVISSMAAFSIAVTEYVDWTQPAVSAVATALTARLAFKTATGNNHVHA